jgi:hypothetical protein
MFRAKLHLFFLPHMALLRCSSNTQRMKRIRRDMGGGGWRNILYYLTHKEKEKGGERRKKKKEVKRKERKGIGKGVKGMERG